MPIYEHADGPAGPDLVKEMATAIDFTIGGSVQLLSGYRGAGKTTELLRLRRELDRDAYVPVYLDIEDYLNTELPLDGGSLFIALAAGFIDNCKEADVPKQGLVARLRDFLDRLEIKGEAGVAASAGPIDLDLKATLRDDKEFRAQVARALESNRKVFKKEMHSFFQEIVSTMPPGKTPVFIVDSIDHYRGRAATFDEVLDSVESVFSTYSSELALPNMHVVYTVPVSGGRRSRGCVGGGAARFLG